MQTFSTRRAGSVIFVICGTLCALVGRVAYLQSYGRQETLGKAERQQHQSLPLYARRGNAYDRNGLLMAGTVQHQSLFVDPHFLHEVFADEGRNPVELDDKIMKLAGFLEQDAFKLQQMFADRAESRFVKIADDLDEARCQEIQKLDLPGVGFVPTNVRIYPMGGLAAHILGECGKDSHGLEGIVLRFDKLLSGKDGYERVLKDSRRRAISVAADDYLPAQHGQHLVLTIDTNMQMFAEQALADACRKNKAKHGEVVVMDPNTGEILALANYPSFEPQNIDDVPAENRRNNAVFFAYEPGSIIKPFVLGPALMWNQTRPTEIWPIEGMRWQTPYGRTITDTHGYGHLSTWDVLVKSSNIGMSMLGERMGNPMLYRALTRWNFGKRTGVELPGEFPGQINPLAKWQKSSTESVAQGYELMVTPIQICRAYCAYANGGRLVKPTIVRGVLDADGRLVLRNNPQSLNELPQVIDPQTAAQMRRIMCDVLVRGTATAGRSDTWNLFGKTGTAHISEGKHGYSLTRFNSSFICGAPAENPRLVAAFIIHEPDRAIAHYGGTVSAPAGKEFMEQALAYLQVPASPELQPPGPGIATALVNFDPKVYKRHAPKNPTQTVDVRD